MAAPNLQSPTTINGKTASVNLSATSETALLSNAASSGKMLRVGSITVTNTSTSGTADITLRYYTAASGGTASRIGSAMTIPVGAAIIIVGRENPIYLEEDRRLTLQASAANFLEIVCSYEEVS
jgi:hypothetical protein